MITIRKSGILLPVTSLPSDYGIGCFSEAAYDFIDTLKKAGQSYWQILPLCPTGFGDSPYQSFSTFAGNPYMISLEELVRENLLTKSECDEYDWGDRENDIDYEKQYKNRYLLLQKAYNRSNVLSDTLYNSFCEKNSWWLDNYALFMALKKYFGGRPWNEWNYTEKCDEAVKDDVGFYKYIQYKFYFQWQKVKSYANENDISIIGDLPIYVSYDSADVRANPELFELDGSGLPINVAGCPPDGFAKEGQLWGNPLYNWEVHQNTGYAWWIKRFEHSFSIYDAVRIDHFRGFDEYYSIKYGSKNAVNGVWRKGPGAQLFNCVKEKLGDKEIIAEDLGFVTDSVKALLSECGFPGMKVLQFAFDARDTGSMGDYQPHNYPDNCIAYTGTHDNQTLLSWFGSISAEERNFVRKYLNDKYTPASEINKSLIALIMRSRAKLCIVPVQDWLGLDDSARINIPSTSGINWKWRLQKNQFSSELVKEIYEMTKIFGRTGNN